MDESVSDWARVCLSVCLFVCSSLSLFLDVNVVLSIQQLYDVTTLIEKRISESVCYQRAILL